MPTAVATDEFIQEIVARIVENYEPDAVILYGSYAWGEPDEGSDLDLFIVKETGGSFFDRWHEVEKAVGNIHPYLSVQPTVLTLNEIERRLGVGDHFIEDILDRGKALYGAIRVRRPERTERMSQAYAQEWLVKAERDWRKLERDLADDDVGASFFLHQSVEKTLKAFLIANGWRLERSHDLAHLVQLATNIDPRFAPYRGVCAEINPFYIADRYPMDHDILGGRELTTEWVQEASDTLAPMIALVRVELSSPSTSNGDDPV